MRALCIGYGFAGERHVKNLVSLGHDVDIVETDVNKREQLSLDYDVYHSIEEAFSKDKFDIALICTPTKNHIVDALSVSLQDGIKAIFCEKPISYNLNGVETLLNICNENNIKLMTGCNLRFDNGIKLISIILNNKTIGDVYSVNYQYGYDLKMWHPNNDYIKSYSQGIAGGASLEDIHSIDLMLYLFGDIKEYVGKLYKIEQLTIQNESIFECILTTQDNIPIHIHSDLLNPYRTRILEVFGLNGQIQYDFFDSKVYLKTVSQNETRVFNVCTDINYMYIQEIKYFINCINNNIVPMNDGIKALNIIETIKQRNKLL